jgi:hypothetical protein
MASKRGLRRRQCGNKNKLTKEAAIRVANGMRQRNAGQNFDGYLCSSCGAWHVGHRPNFIRQEINKRRVA